MSFLRDPVPALKSKFRTALRSIDTLVVLYGPAVGTDKTDSHTLG